MGLAAAARPRRADEILLRRSQPVGAVRNGELRRIRGRDIAMIFQEPMTSLNPVLTIGDQIIEVLRIHENLSRAPGSRARHRASGPRQYSGSRPVASTTILTSFLAACASA